MRVVQGQATTRAAGQRDLLDHRCLARNELIKQARDRGAVAAIGPRVDEHVVAHPRCPQRPPDQRLVLVEHFASAAALDGGLGRHVVLVRVEAAHGEHVLATGASCAGRDVRGKVRAAHVANV